MELDRELGNKEGDRTSFNPISPQEGIATHVYGAFDPEILKRNGAYLLDTKVAPDEEIKQYAVDKKNAERLWKVSEEIVGQEFGI